MFDFAVVILDAWQMPSIRPPSANTLVLPDCETERQILSDTSQCEVELQRRNAATAASGRSKASI
jgi:hypothetical protein